MTGTTYHHITDGNQANSCSYALGGEPYTILFHIGEFPEQEISTRTTALTQHSRFVGSVYNFSSPMIGADGQRVCENCDQQAVAGSLSTAQIPLTMTLYYHAADANIRELDQMSPDQVEAYLEKHLHWVVVSVSTRISSRMPRFNNLARPVDKSSGSKIFRKQRSLCLREAHSISTLRIGLRSMDGIQQCHVLRRISQVALRTTNTASKSARGYVQLVISIILVTLLNICHVRVSKYETGAL